MLQLLPRTTRISRWSLLFAIALAGTLLALALRDVNWSEMGETIHRGRPLYLALGFATLTLSYFVRGLRWRVLLSADRLIAPLTVFWATAIGYLGNYVLPLRAGEIIRSALIGRTAGMSTSYVLATAFTERIVDLVALLLISLVSLLSLGTLPGWMLPEVKIMTAVGCGAFLGLLVAPHLEAWQRRLVARLPLPCTLRTRVLDVLEPFLLGMRALQHPGRGLAFLALTALVWSLDTVVAVEIATVFKLVLTPAQALLLLAALGLSSAAPSTPGYVGIYQFVAVTVLVPFGFSRSNALVFILTYQAVIYAVVIAWGTIGLWRLYMRTRPVPHSLSVPVEAPQ